MVYIPFVYFVGLGAYLYLKHRRWGMDIAAVFILIVISFFAIMIDIRDLYGDYGINDYHITLPTIVLFCLQWTLVIMPFTVLQDIPLEKHSDIKSPLLYLLFIVVTLSSFLLVANSGEAIRNAMVMDLADVRNEHYQDLSAGGGKDTNYLMFLPTIICQPPFPTLALFLWFYMQTFMKSNLILRMGVLFASIVQAILAIVMAGRAAIIYWAFDFFMLFSYFHQYMSKRLKRAIMGVVLVVGGLIGTVFIAITISRFDTSDNSSRDPLSSIYGYAGQHVNNFCVMFEEGGQSPFQIDRIFPLTNKILTGNTFDLMAHYDTIVQYIKPMVNVFDTFGAEIYLDLGWFGYIMFFILYFMYTQYMKQRWDNLPFYRAFILVIFVTFFTKGLFAWPFTHHYTTMAIILMLSGCYFFRYIFKV